MEVKMYTNLISAVNTRISTIKGVLGKEFSTGFEHTDMEFVSHQIIICLELIALGSLIPNEEEYNRQLFKFKSSMDVNGILDDLGLLNPNFYPSPLTPKIKGNFDSVNMEERKEGFLSKNEFVVVYNECQRFLHAEYPFNDGQDYELYFNKLGKWVNLISGLMEVFTVKLLNPDIPTLLVHSDDETTESHRLILIED